MAIVLLSFLGARVGVLLLSSLVLRLLPVALVRGFVSGSFMLLVEGSSLTFDLVDLFPNDLRVRPATRLGGFRVSSSI